ncbi:uncharacterized protein LOC143878893 [Tasmannia lanceolata]|uniref:uncharacterized protein LOC143878893 n=1 Tax=Tasmannia lanceolata TaxID=3420 RepID=UPI004062CAFC
MTKSPVLALPNFSLPFIIECDASGLGVVAVLMQMGRPLAYFSQALHGRNLSLSTYEKELHAIIMAVKKWRPYLLGRKFVIRTDQRSLKFLLEQKIATPMQQKWLSKLMGYDYQIEYKKGAENKVADALSRIQDGEIFAISNPVPTWLERVKEEIIRDAYLQQIRNKIEEGELDVAKYKEVDGILWRKGRILLGPASPLRKEFFLEHHASPTAGHSGFQNTAIKENDHFFLLARVKKRHQNSKSAAFVNKSIPGSTKVQAVEEELKDRDKALQLIKENLWMAQERMKTFADKHRTEKSFNVGDWVYLRLQPYRQVSVAARRSMKLAARYFGPFQILQKVGPVAYKLELPQRSKIFPVFHVSQLKKKIGEQIQPSTNLPPLSEDGNLQPYPESILARRMVRRGNAADTEVLVQWQGTPEADATWERLRWLEEKFPDANLVDMVSLRGGE